MSRLRIRLAEPQDHSEMEKLIIESFEPITWARKLDERFGPLNGLDWQARWRSRLQKVFTTQIVLVGFAESVLTAVSTSTLDTDPALAYIDIFAVAPSQQGLGYGREMLRGTMAYLRELGATSVHLDCLSSNQEGNALYESEGFEEVARHIRWFRRI